MNTAVLFRLAAGGSAETETVAPPVQAARRGDLDTLPDEVWTGHAGDLLPESTRQAPPRPASMPGRRQIQAAGPDFTRSHKGPAIAGAEPGDRALIVGPATADVQPPAIGPGLSRNRAMFRRRPTLGPDGDLPPRTP